MNDARTPAPPEHAERHAQEAAEAWLGLVDRGAYGESWQHAASSFKSLVPLEEWQRVTTGVRHPLGTVESRLLQSREYRTTLPGSPDGHYVVCRYATAFAQKGASAETVACVLDPDLRWRVSGYFIK